MTCPNLHQIRLGPNAVSEALDQAAAFADAEGIEVSAELAMIVEELVCNLVEHGRRGESGMIEIGIFRSADGVRLTLIDDCAPFDPRTAPAVGDLPPDRGGGAGLALVRAWSRILSYAQAGDRNILNLVIPDR
jgi:anti-sigma regulatory factor (Ser/Thr protein kinase)